MDDIIPNGYRAHIGFTLLFEGGRYHSRYGHSVKFPLGPEDIVEDPKDGPAVLVNWTDNARSQPIKRHVPVRFLRPAPPTKKGVEVVILKHGDEYGHTVKVAQYSRKTKKAVLDNSNTYSEGELCVISGEDTSSA